MQSSACVNMGMNGAEAPKQQGIFKQPVLILIFILVLTPPFLLGLHLSHLPLPASFPVPVLTLGLRGPSRVLYTASKPEPLASVSLLDEPGKTPDMM